MVSFQKDHVYNPHMNSNNVKLHMGSVFPEVGMQGRLRISPSPFSFLFLKNEKWLSAHDHPVFAYCKIRPTPR